MSDAQLGFDIDPTEDAWQAWVDPDTMAARLGEFLARMGEGIPDDGKETWWKPPYSTRIMEAVLKECGTWEAFAAPENHELADGFFRFIGECYIRRDGNMKWTNRPGKGSPIYDDIGPALQLSETQAIFLRGDAKELFQENFGPRMVEHSIKNARQEVW